MTYFLFTITLPTLCFQDVFPWSKKKKTAYFNTTYSTDQTERVFKWKLWFTCLITEVSWWNNPGIDFFFSFSNVFSIDCFHYIGTIFLHPVYTLLYFPSSLPLLLLGQDSIKFLQLFMAVDLFFHQERERKKVYSNGIPPWQIVRGQLPSSWAPDFCQSKYCWNWSQVGLL